MQTVASLTVCARARISTSELPWSASFAAAGAEPVLALTILKASRLAFSAFFQTNCSKPIAQPLASAFGSHLPQTLCKFQLYTVSLSLCTIMHVVAHMLLAVASCAL